MPSIFAEIDTPLSFTRFQALPGDSSKPGCYPGVLVIETGAAKGHFAVKDGNRIVNYNPTNPDHGKLERFQIVISHETLDDVVKCGIENELTKCKLDHGSTVRDIVGEYGKFRRDGSQVRADLELDSRLDGYDHALALVDKFAKKIGNSIDFDYTYEIKGDVAIARCRKLNSVDIVDAPAATKALFSQNLTTQPTPHMPLDAADIKVIGDLFDTKFSSVNTEFATLKGEVSTLSKKFEEGDGEKKNKDEDEKKEAEMAAKFAEIASKATLAAVETAFPKAQREQFAKLGEVPGKSKFEQLVDTQIAAGAANRGIAIQRIARDHADVYNAHMSAQNGGSTTL